MARGGAGAGPGGRRAGRDRLAGGPRARRRPARHAGPGAPRRAGRLLGLARLPRSRPPGDPPSRSRALLLALRIPMPVARRSQGDGGPGRRLAASARADGQRGTPRRTARRRHADAPLAGEAGRCAGRAAGRERAGPRADPASGRAARRQSCQILGGGPCRGEGLHPLRPLQMRHPDGVRRRPARRRASCSSASSPATRRTSPAARSSAPPGSCSIAPWPRPGSTASATYVTNAVKHFKFERRGKRRIHDKPNAGEIAACRWWLQQELALIRPPLTVALGATAARALFGKVVTISSLRGAAHELPEGGEAWVTVHPSFLLRVRDDKEAEYARFVEDLRTGSASGRRRWPEAALERPASCRYCRR